MLTWAVMRTFYGHTTVVFLAFYIVWPFYSIYFNITLKAFKLVECRF